MRKTGFLRGFIGLIIANWQLQFYKQARLAQGFIKVLNGSQAFSVLIEDL